MSCFQVSSEAAQNILTQQYHAMHHISNASDGELLRRGVSINICTREMYSPHGTTGKRSSVSLLLHIAVQILVRGLQRVPNPSSLFVPNKAMLEWAFRQQSLVSGAARSWVRRVDCWLRTGVNFFSLPKNAKTRGWMFYCLCLHITCSLFSG